MSIYNCPTWLPGGHLQTIYPLLRKGLATPLQRQRWETPDNDFIDVDSLQPFEQSASNTVFVLFHGLEGDSSSPYALSFMRHWYALGTQALIPHFRGCSGQPNRLARAYHSGDSAEINWILRRIRQQHAGAKIYVVGISLGGNALLKWLGEQQAKARQVIDAAASVCAPLVLADCDQILSRGFHRAVYTQRFLRTLVPKALFKIQRHKLNLNRERLRQAKTLFDFDEYYTAPVHGFADAQDYYQQSSARQFLSNIQLPTLLLNAANDPFVPASAIPNKSELSAAVRFDYLSHGGHVGFVSGAFPGHINWLAKHVSQFLQSQTAIESPLTTSEIDI